MRCYAKGRLMFNWLLHAVSVQFLRTRGRSLRICVNLILIKSAYKRLITSESGGICDPLSERSFARIHNGQEKGFWVVRATMRMIISHRSLCIHCDRSRHSMRLSRCKPSKLWPSSGLLKMAESELLNR